MRTLQSKALFPLSKPLRLLHSYFHGMSEQIWSSDRLKRKLHCRLQYVDPIAFRTDESHYSVADFETSKIFRLQLVQQDFVYQKDHHDMLVTFVPIHNVAFSFKQTNCTSSIVVSTRISWGCQFEEDLLQYNFQAMKQAHVNHKIERERERLEVNVTHIWQRQDLSYEACCTLNVNKVN